MNTVKFVLLVLAGLIGLILTVEILGVLLVIISSLFINTKKEHNKNNRFFRGMINVSAAIVIWLDRIHVHVTGLEKIPAGTRFLLVSNHRSKFDPITTWHVLRKYDVAFITKPENLKIPFYGKIIQKCCFMPINRENPRLAIPTIERAIMLLKKDEVSIGVYPEGTRSKTLELQPFHAAVFKIAVSAKVPVVVMTAYKTETIAKAFPFGRSDVYLDFLDVIPAEDVQKMRSVELSNRCEAIIKQKLDEYNLSEKN